MLTIGYLEEEGFPRISWEFWPIDGAVLEPPFILNPVKVQKITIAVLTLHNWLNSDRLSRNVYCPPGLTHNENPVTGEIIEGTWRDNSPLESLVSLQPSLKHNYNRGAQEMRQEYTRWFNNEGDVPWQRKMRESLVIAKLAYKRN